jgi:hypothetical protein
MAIIVHTAIIIIIIVWSRVVPLGLWRLVFKRGALSGLLFCCREWRGCYTSSWRVWNRQETLRSCFMMPMKASTFSHQGGNGSRARDSKTSFMPDELGCFQMVTVYPDITCDVKPSIWVCLQ